MRRSKTVIAAVVLSLTVGQAFQHSRQVIRVGPDLKLPFSPAVKAGNFIHVSGTLATDDSGRIVSGGIKAQTKQVLENISRILQAGGSSLENAASVNVYLRNIADFQAMNEVYQAYWPKDPPARTTVSGRLVLPDALVEISMVAIAKGAERKVIHPQGWLKPPLPYSYGILSGDTLFMAGLVARNNKDNQPVPGETKDQVKAVMENAGEVLKAAGMSVSEVVSSRVFITDVALFQEMNAAYRSWFPKDPPARATVVAGLVTSQYKVEISMQAVRGSQRVAFTTPNADGSPGQANPNLSSAIRIGNRLYLSGMLGNSASNKGDIRAQTRETLERIGRTLKAAGYDWGQVVDGVVYLPDLHNFGGMNEAYREIFSGDFPARATIGTGLVAPDGLVEIMLTAAK
jgi:reactive intermediate/imine deaminase